MEGGSISAMRSTLTTIRRCPGSFRDTHLDAAHNVTPLIRDTEYMKYPLFREPLLRIAAASGALNHSRCLQPRKFWHGQTQLCPIHIRVMLAQAGRRSTSRQRIGAVHQETGARVPE